MRIITEKEVRKKNFLIKYVLESYVNSVGGVCVCVKIQVYYTGSDSIDLDLFFF